MNSLQEVLRESAEPLKSTAIRKLLGIKSAKQLKSDLEAEVNAGRIYFWGSGMYWDRNPSTIARERLLKVAASELLKASDLVKRAAADGQKISSKVVTAARKELEAEGLLRVVAKVYVNAEHPEAYLQQQIGHLLSEFKIERTREQIRVFLALATPEMEVRDVAEKIFAAMNRIAFAPGTTVTFYRLRQQPELADIPKAIFDQAALLLQKERTALLEEHGHAARLPKAEQDMLVNDGLGTYYVSIYSL